jgi:hypothetical protein
MADSDHDHNEPLILDGVDNPVVADTNTPQAIRAGQLASAGRAGIMFERSERPHDSGTMRRIYAI